MNLKQNKAPSKPKKQSSNQQIDPQEQFLKKVLYCSDIYDFNDEAKCQEEKKIRMQYLKEIIETI